MPNLNHEPALSVAGTRGIFLNAAQAQFNCEVQNRILAMAEVLAACEMVHEVVPGVNSLLVVYEPREVTMETLRDRILTVWNSTPLVAIKGREFEVPVVYGGAQGEDLKQAAEYCGLSVSELVKIHSSSVYTVACVGAMPGFPYLTGLDERLMIPRRANPRLSLAGGSVTIGGSQASITPCAAPSGWHAIGHTPIKLFDPEANPAALLRPGDRIRFVIERIDQ